MGGGYQPKRSGVYAVAQRIFNIERSIAALNARISGLGIQVDKANGKLIISSGRSLEVDGSETIGGSLTVTGNTLIEGNLSVPNGSITNAALSNPVIPLNGLATGSNYSLPVITTFGPGGGGTTRATVTLTVPANCTSAILLAVAQDAAYNSTAATDTLYSIIDVVGLSYFQAPSADVPSHAWGACITNDYKLLTGLTPGQVITINSKPGTLNAAWATNVDNGTSLDVVALFLH